MLLDLWFTAIPPAKSLHQASVFRELLNGLVPCGEVGFITRRARRALASIRCSSRPGFSGSHSRRAIAFSAVFIFSGKHSDRGSTIAATTACCHGYFMVASIASTSRSNAGPLLETWFDRRSLRACFVRSPAPSYGQLTALLTPVRLRLELGLRRPQRKAVG